MEDTKDIMKKVEESLKKAEEYKREQWELVKYYQILSLIKEAKHLAKELDAELGRLNINASALEKT